MKKKKICGFLLLLIANILWIVTFWFNQQFPDLDFSSIMFYIKVPLDGSNTMAFSKIIIFTAVAAPLITTLSYLTTKMLDETHALELQIRNFKLNLPLNLWRRRFCSISAIFLAITAVSCSYLTGLTTYIYNNLHTSTIYKTYYVDPRNANITFPESKRNLIYIFMESMENTYASEEYGGLEYANFIPEMCDLQFENTTFSTLDSTLNGALSTSGTTWTMGAMIAQTTGIPLNIPVYGNTMEESSSAFLPGACSIGELLAEQGYQQELLLGSNAVFGGRGLYFSQHGDYTIKDYNYTIDNEILPSDYYIWWGYEDEKLYDFAKEELTTLAESDAPFNLTMLTVDTHFFDGYYCELCEPNFDNDQYANVIACASRQVTEFVQWVQEQPFYDNTTIIICGDHPTMDTEYLNQSCVNDFSTYQRSTYTVVINPAVEYELDYTRAFTTLDMYPTTLASLGCEIEGNRLGLGTNLFSDTPTLLEEMGLEKLDSELEKVSTYYNKNLLYPDNQHHRLSRWFALPL